VHFRSFGHIDSSDFVVRRADNGRRWNRRHYRRICYALYLLPSFVSTPQAVGLDLQFGCDLFGDEQLLLSCLHSPADFLDQARSKAVF